MDRTILSHLNAKGGNILDLKKDATSKSVKTWPLSS